MKKSLLILPLIVVSLSGCNPVPSDTSIDYGELLSIEVSDGLKDEYVRYTVVDLNEISVTATFVNGNKTVEGSELTFDPETLSTSEIGEFEITISYQTESVVWTYAVIEYDEISNIGAPQFVVDYQFNSALKDNKQTEFMDREQGFVVGDDNPFKFFPTIYAYDADGLEVDVTAYHSVSVIKEKRSDVWVTLSGTELEAVVAIDDLASTYDFTEQAIGKEYQLTVRPYGDEYATKAKYATSFEFRVEDGYNVYTQDDLVHFNNYNALWDTYRTENEITPIEISGLFFQNDITINRNKLPDGFFYMAGDSDISSGDADYGRIIGSLRDNVDIYQRNIAADDSFVFNGNYFNLDFSSLPVVVREAGKDPFSEPGQVISHATVIKAGIPEVRDPRGDFLMTNLSVIGNANRTDEQPEKSGGAIYLKTQSVDAHLYNLIMTQCFTAVLSEYYATDFVIEKTRGYDSFSSMLYNYGTDDFLIKDCEFIGAGGPILIADHVSPDANGNGGYQSHTRSENSVLESFVTGNENWFRLVKATGAVPGIVGLGEQVLLGYGRNTITKIVNINGIDVPHFNMVGLIKDSAVASPSSTKINGTFQIDDGVALDFSGQFMSAVGAYPAAMPRFQSTGGEVALFDGEKLVNAQNQPITPYVYTNTNYFTGDYMNIYNNIVTGDGFMGMIFELVDRPA